MKKKPTYFFLISRRHCVYGYNGASFFERGKKLWVRHIGLTGLTINRPECNASISSSYCVVSIEFDNFCTPSRGGLFEIESTYPRIKVDLFFFSSIGLIRNRKYGASLCCFVDTVEEIYYGLAVLVRSLSEGMWKGINSETHLQNWFWVQREMRFLAIVSVIYENFLYLWCDPLLDTPLYSCACWPNFPFGAGYPSLLLGCLMGQRHYECVHGWRWEAISDRW